MSDTPHRQDLTDAVEFALSRHQEAWTTYRAADKALAKARDEVVWARMQLREWVEKKYGHLTGVCVTDPDGTVY